MCESFLCKIFAWPFWLFEWLLALDFLRFAWSKIPSQSQFHAAELNWRQFNTQSEMKSAPKLVPFFTLNLNSGFIFTSNVVIWSALLNFVAHFGSPPPPPPDWSRLQLIRAPSSRSRAILPTFSVLCILYLSFNEE